MKVQYIIEDHIAGKEIKEFESVFDFLNEFPMYSSLLSEGREDYEVEIIVNVPNLLFSSRLRLTKEL
jgi:hypothetical protein